MERRFPPRLSGRPGVAALLPLAASGLLQAAPSSLEAQPRREEVVIAATTDVHGRLRGWDYYANRPDGRFSQAAAATIVDSVRSANPGRVVLVDAGDLLQGNPLLYVAAKVAPPPVHPVVAVMNVMRYDAAALGNHEFNYGVPHLRSALARAAFPFLAANVRDGTGRPFVAPSTIVTRGGIRIGIVGGTTPGSMIWDRDHLRAAGLEVTDLVLGVRRAVEVLRRQRVDVVVAVLHSGLDGASTYDTVATGLGGENVAGQVAREIPGIDVVVVGHSHREIVDTTIGSTLVVQPRNWAGSVALATLTLERNGRRWRVMSRRGQSVAVANHAEHPAVLAAITRTHAATVDWVTRPLGRTAVTWRSDSARVVDAPISDFVAEVMRREGQAELAVTSAFSLDATLEEGPVTRAQLSKLYPYDNTLRVIRISGAQLRAYLEHSARYYRTLTPEGTAPAGGLIDQSIAGYNFDLVSGADYVIDLTKPVGSRITTLTVKGRPVQPTDSFTLAVNNYRQTGGGNYAMLAGAPVLYSKDTDIRQLLMDELERVGTLDPSRYAVRNWSLEPAAARAIAYDEQRRGVRAESSGRSPAAEGRTPASASAPGAIAGRRLRVIAMSDFHAQLPPRREGQRLAGGAVALSAALRTAQRECAPPDCESVILDAGDLFTGTPASDWDGGRPTVQVVNRFDVAAGALGNHEFDFGQDTLRMRLRELRHAVLGANVRDATGQLPTWLRADTLVLRGGLRIGIVGAAGTHTPSTASRRKVGALTFLDPVPVYVERARALRARGAQVILFVLHDGGRCDRERSCEGGGITVANRLAALGPDRPDAFIMGHAHVNLALDLEGMPAVEPTANGRGIVLVDIPLAGGRARTEIRSVAAADSVGADPVVDSIVRTSMARVMAQMESPVATLATPLRRTGDQSPLGNLIADAVRVAGGGDFGIWNNGGIRADLQAGPLRFGSVHEVTPFGNMLVRVRIRGRDLPAFLEPGLDRGRPNIHVAGALVTYDPTRTGSRQITSVRLADGRPIDPAREYTMIVSDFVWEGADASWRALGGGAEYLPLRDSQVIADFLRRQPQPVRGDDTIRIRPAAGGTP